MNFYKVYFGKDNKINSSEMENIELDILELSDVL